MPIYKYQDTNTGKIWEQFQSIADRQKFLDDNPHIKQLINWQCGSIDGLKAQDKQIADVATEHYRFSGNKGVQEGLKQHLPDGVREF